MADDRLDQQPDQRRGDPQHREIVDLQSKRLETPLMFAFCGAMSIWEQPGIPWRGFAFGYNLRRAALPPAAPSTLSYPGRSPHHQPRRRQHQAARRLSPNPREQRLNRRPPGQSRVLRHRRQRRVAEARLRHCRSRS